MSSHSIEKVKVLEYWDNTEYFNISAVTSGKYAYESDKVNPRYFDNVFNRQQDGRLVPKDGIAFTNDEINTFYLSSLGLKNNLHGIDSNKTSRLSSDFYDFLSVVFDIAADTSYYD